MRGNSQGRPPLPSQLHTVEGYLQAVHFSITPRSPALGRIEAVLGARSPHCKVALQVPQPERRKMKDGYRLIAVDRDTTPSIGMHEIGHLAVDDLCSWTAMPMQFIRPTSLGGKPSSTSPSSDGCSSSKVGPPVPPN